MRLFNKFRFSYVLFTILAIIVFSCSIDENVDVLSENQSTLSIEEAKLAYETSFKNVGLSSSRTTKKKFWEDITPDWSKSRNGSKHKNSVITPLKHGKFVWDDGVKSPTS